MVGMLSDVGNYRAINEDSVGYCELDNMAIYIIADGMGGHNAGEVASKLAVDTVMDYFKNITNLGDLSDELVKVIQSANENIFHMAKENDKLQGMGTTITACLIKQHNVVIANVGDSSCYVINNENKLIKITKDHSLVQQLVDNGSITEEQALYHPNKNIITRALGTKSCVEVDIFSLNFKNIKRIILCTDGLTNDVNPQEMYDIIMNNNNKDSCKLLIELSKKKGRKR